MMWNFCFGKTKGKLFQMPKFWLKVLQSQKNLYRKYHKIFRGELKIGKNDRFFNQIITAFLELRFIAFCA